jgi:hypothetical protein
MLGVPPRMTVDIRSRRDAAPTSAGVNLDHRGSRRSYNGCRSRRNGSRRRVVYHFESEAREPQIAALSADHA